MLGWRSGVNEMLITFFAVYFFNRGGKVRLADLRLVFYLVLFLIILFIVINIQNDVRQSDKSFYDVWVRLWGIRYLDSVVAFFNDNRASTLTNDFFGLYLMENGFSTSDFHNKIIVGDALGKHHGNARTNFGSTYMIGGLIFVAICFLLVGLWHGFFITGDKIIFTP